MQHVLMSVLASIGFVLCSGFVLWGTSSLQLAQAADAPPLVLAQKPPLVLTQKQPLAKVQKIKRLGLQWWPLAAGLAEAKKKSRPLLLFYGGAQPAEYWAMLEEPFAKAGKSPSQFIAVIVPRPVPKAAAEILGGIDSEPLIALCDFRGTALKRWDNKAPTRKSLRKHSRRAYVISNATAKKFESALQLLKKAGYALKIDKTKECCKLYLQTEKLQLAPQSEPVKQRLKLRQEIDQVIAERRKEGQGFEDQGDLASAVAVYEKIIADFPLPDVRIEMRERVTDLWSRLRGGLGG